MARLGINTGLSPNDGTGDTLLEGAVKINDNFNEIYTRFGDGDNLAGIATNVIGGDNIDVTSPIGNVVISVSAASTLTCTSVDIYEGGLTVGGISTLGIVTGVESINVTNLYSSFLYGDGSNLTGISRTDFTNTESLVVTGVSTLGVITGADSIEVTDVYSTDIKTSSIDATSINATSYTGDGSNLTGVLNSNATASQLVVTGVSTLGIVTGLESIGVNNIYGGLIYGNGHNLAGVCKQTTAIANQLFIVGVSTLGIVTDVNSIGVGDLYATKLYGDGSNITGVAKTSNVSTDTLVVSGVSTLGVVTGAESIQSTTFYGDGSYLTDGRWELGANGVSGYVFSGVGFPSQVEDPDLYLARGRVYEFVNNMGQHPFRIQSTQNGSNGPLYDTGVTNNNTSSGTIRFEVPFDAPDTLWYQCSTHTGMGGTIFIYPTLR